MPWAYYNEIDPYAAQWLRNLITNKLITPGEVDERPIQDVKPSDLTQFTRCHFFAGIAGWDIALNLANYPADKPVWTGSCPCQPFSTAGKRLQFADERHLWPFWFHLISVCRPPVIFGEQVANGSGPWLDLVLADLESEDYAVGAAVLPAAGVGAPHIRDRVWFVAESDRQRQHGLPLDAEVAAVPKFVAHAASELCERRRDVGARGRLEPANSGIISDSLGNPLWDQPGWSGRPNGSGAPEPRELGEDASDSYPPRPPLRRESQLLGQCASSQRSDWWTVEPSLGRVVDGFPTRAQRLRAYGNAIVPQAAQVFIEAYLKCQP